MWKRKEGGREGPQVKISKDNPTMPRSSHFHSPLVIQWQAGVADTIQYCKGKEHDWEKGQRGQCCQETAQGHGRNRWLETDLEVKDGGRDHWQHLGSSTEERDGPIAGGRPQSSGELVFRTGETWEYLWAEEQRSGRRCGQRGNVGAWEVMKWLNGEMGGVSFDSWNHPLRCRKAAETLERLLVNMGLFMDLKSSDLYFSRELAAQWELSGLRKRGEKEKVGESALGNGIWSREEWTQWSAQPGRWRWGSRA